MPAAPPASDDNHGRTAGTRPAAARRRTALALALLAAVPIFYALFVIRDFRGPIGDHSESFLSEYQAFYTAKHLSLWPLPHLDLVNDDILYPYGTNGALQSWCVERDVLGAALTRLFGRGPFLQFYYLAGVILSVALAFLLLRRDHGDLRAAAASALMHGFNFYSMQKYPYHFNIAVCHWTVAGIVCDFVIVERAVRGRHVSLRLLGLRALLLALSFGLELGHVLGYALTSALLAGTFLLGRAIWIRWRAGARLADVRAGIAAALARRKAEARADAPVLAALGAALAAVTWLYGSIVAGIVLDTRAYDFGRVQLGVWWSHPLRLLIPYFPLLHPSQQPRFLNVRGDIAEVGIGSGGAGWLLLGLALLGVWQARRRIAPLVPILAALAMYIASGPHLPLLRLLPWFAFMRVYSRATLVYSVLFTLLAIDVSFDRMRGRRLVLAALLAVGALELSTLVLIKRGAAAYAPQPAVLSYFDRIKQQPGEALLDWPFCIIGGNGQIGELCPYWEKMRGVFALQRFHEKKVIGQYLGRLHPLQVKPFVDAGWPKLFEPDSADPIKADKQRRCLDDDEWALFTDFYRYNDFAGIQLALDRLPPGCAESFYSRFGAPAGETAVAAAGRLAFIPKPPAERALVDRARGRAAHLATPPLGPTELVSFHRPHGVDVDGLAPLEEEDGAAWRWALGPLARVRFLVQEPREVTLRGDFWSFLDGQSIEVLVDGQPVGTWGDLPAKTRVSRALSFAAAPGPHAVELRFRRWNGRPGDTWVPLDGRALAVRAYSLRLDPK